MLHAQDRSPRSRLPQDKRREQLMDATIEVVAEYGLAGVTLGKVAERADLTAAMVNFHFETKQDLLDATLARMAAEMKENLDQAVERGDGSAIATLVELADTSFDPIVFSPEKLATLEAFWGAGVSNPHYMSICEATAADYENRLCAMFDRLADATGTAIDNRVASLGLIGLIDVMWWRIMAEQITVNDAKKDCRKYIANLFPAYAAVLPNAR